MSPVVTGHGTSRERPRGGPSRPAINFGRGRLVLARAFRAVPTTSRFRTAVFGGNDLVGTVARNLVEPARCPVDGCFTTETTVRPVLIAVPVEVRTCSLEPIPLALSVVGFVWIVSVRASKTMDLAGVVTAFILVSTGQSHA